MIEKMAPMPTKMATDGRWYQFRIIGVPQAKARHRSAGTGLGDKSRRYTPRTTKAWEILIHNSANQIDLPKFTGAVQVEVMFFWEWPEARRRRAKSRRQSLPESIFMTQPPDGDNVEKAFLDGLKHYLNDKIVVDLHWQKRRAAQGDPPCVIVRMREINEELPRLFSGHGTAR